MKQLKGTEKQVKWANDLREKFIEIIKNFKFNLHSENFQEKETFVNNVKFIYTKNTMNFRRVWKMDKTQDQKEVICKLAYEEFLKAANYIIDNEEDATFYIENRMFINDKNKTYFDDIYMNDFAALVNYYYSKHELQKKDL